MLWNTKQDAVTVIQRRIKHLGSRLPTADAAAERAAHGDGAHGNCTKRHHNAPSSTRERQQAVAKETQQAQVASRRWVDVVAEVINFSLF